jgi:hypothetical protein
MTWLLNNENSSPLVAAERPMPSLLRDRERESSACGIRIGVTDLSRRSRTAVKLIGRPLVVTTTRPEATICTPQRSVTSLISQGPVSNV